VSALSSPQANTVNLTACFLHPFTILALNSTIPEEVMKVPMIRLSSHFSRDYRFPDVAIKFVFLGYCFDSDVATMTDTVLLALFPVAIALIYFFSEPLVGSQLVDRCRRNAPCPDLIVPSLMERRGQSAKTLVWVLLGDN
jgi:hypothetical protein